VEQSRVRGQAPTEHYGQLRTDLARFTFLLGHDDGESPFGPGDQQE